MKHIQKISRLTFPVTLLTGLIILVYSRNLCGYESRTSLHGEIVRDIINYSDEEASLLARIRLSENIDDTFLFNYSLLRDINSEKNQYTWNAELREVNDHFNFIAGNYNLRFGSGLLMGKKKFITSDSFTRSLTVSSDESIIAAKGTNPSGTFFGSAAEIYITSDNCSAGLIPFISSQKRYITQQELEQGYVGASLSTLSDRTARDSKYSEYVNIITYGGMTWFSFIDCITLQAYGFTTELLDPERRKMKWEYNTGNNSGINRYKACGLFLEYSDEVISFFIEPALSIREYNDSAKGKAVLWGCGVKSRTALFSVRGKNCDSGFRAEYASGDRNPENAFEIKTGITPFDNFEMGALFYSEKNINPSRNSDYAGGVVREEIYCGMKPFKWAELDFTGARARSYSDDLDTEKLKLSSDVLFSLPWNLYFRIMSDIQKDGSSLAHVSACELKYLFSNYFTLSTGYTHIMSGSGIYAAIIPAAEAEMSAALYREDAKGAAVKLKYRRDTLSFHGRISLVETAGEREVTAESSLGFIF